MVCARSSIVGKFDEIWVVLSDEGDTSTPFLRGVKASLEPSMSVKNIDISNIPFRMKLLPWYFPTTA